MTARLLLVLTSVLFWADAAIAGAPVPLVKEFARRNEIFGPAQERVLRMDLDVTGDGRPELLLAVAARHAQTWTIYSWVGTNQVQALGEIEFAYSAFMLQSDPVAMVIPYETDDGKTGVATYIVNSTGVHHISDSVVAPTGTPTAGPTSTPTPVLDFVSWRKAVGLTVASADFDDVRKNAAPKWVDAFTVQPVTGLGGLLDVTVVDASSAAPPIATTTATPTATAAATPTP